MKKKHRLPLPQYTYEAPYLSLKFLRNSEMIKKLPDHKSLEALTIEELVGYSWLKEQGETSRKEYATHFLMEGKKASRQLIKIKDFNLIADNGAPVRSNKYKYSFIA